MKKLTMMLAAGCLLAGCAHSAIDEQVDKKLAQESSIKSRDDLRKEAARDIKDSKGLTEKQKTELNQLRDTVTANEDAIWRQQLRLRAVLIKDMLSSNYNQSEIEVIQKRLRNLEDKRLTAQFEAIDRANKILGHEFEDVDMLNEWFEPNQIRY